MIQLTSSLNLGPLHSFTEGFKKEAEIAIKRTTLKVEGDAKVNAPVDTGFLRSSIASSFPEQLKGLVSVSAHYAAHVNYGTRRMAAQPFLTTAGKQNVAFFDAEMIQAVARAGRDAGFK